MGFVGDSRARRFCLREQSVDVGLVLDDMSDAELATSRRSN
jgi:hypothetical protein